jgi:hypothetical protein
MGRKKVQQRGAPTLDTFRHKQGTSSTTGPAGRLEVSSCVLRSAATLLISKAAEAGSSTLEQQFELDRDAPLLPGTGHGPSTSAQPRAENKSPKPPKLRTSLGTGKPP